MTDSRITQISSEVLAPAGEGMADSRITQISSEVIAPAGEGLFKGFLISILATKVPASYSQYDYNDTNHPDYADRYELTAGAGLGVFGFSTNGSSIKPTGMINWFNKNATYTLTVSEGNLEPDYAQHRVNFLDAANNIVCWYDTYSYSSYANKMRYGLSGSSYTTGHTGSYPRNNGYFTFNLAAGTMSYTNVRTTHYNHSWTLSGVDVGSIIKMEVVSSNVQSSYSSSGSAVVSLYVEEIGQVITPVQTTAISQEVLTSMEAEPYKVYCSSVYSDALLVTSANQLPHRVNSYYGAEPNTYQLTTSALLMAAQGSGIQAFNTPNPAGVGVRRCHLSALVRGS